MEAVKCFMVLFYKNEHKINNIPKQYVRNKTRPGGVLLQEKCLMTGKRITLDYFPTTVCPEVLYSFCVEAICQ